MAERSGQHLFLVAGYPASGKSTLLTHGAKGRAVVFGEEYDPTFRSAIPAAEPNEQLATKAKLDKGLWFTLSDVNTLERLDRLPSNLVFHLDLLLFLLVLLQPKDSSELNRRTTSGAFRGLLDRKLFARYQRIVACTLLPDFDLVRGNWRQRLEAGMTLDGYLLSAKNDIIMNVPDPRGFYEGICHEWIVAVSEKSCRHCIREWQGGGDDLPP